MSTATLDRFLDRRVVWRVVAIAVLVETVSLASGIAYEFHLRSVGRRDLSSWGEGWMVVAMALSTTVVGASLMVRRPDHPVGWLFVALGTTVSVVAPLDSYSLHGLLVEPGSLPAATALGGVGSFSFVPWLVLIASILHVTPTGRPLSPRFALAWRITVYAAIVMVATGLASNRTLDPPYPPVVNPLAAGPLAGTFRVISALAITIVGIGVLVAATSLVVRFGRAQGIERLQLSWLAITAVPRRWRVFTTPLCSTVMIVFGAKPRPCRPRSHSFAIPWPRRYGRATGHRPAAR